MDGAKKAELEASAKHWEALAEEQDRFAEFARGRGEYAGVHANKAKDYRDTAKALRLEAETGLWYCSCCLKPRALPGAHGRVRW